MLANIFTQVAKHRFHWNKPSGELFDLDFGGLVQNHGSIGASPMVAYAQWLKHHATPAARLTAIESLRKRISGRGRKLV